MKLRTPTRPKGFSGGAVVKNLLANAEDTGLVSELGRSPGEGNGSPCPPLHPPPAQVFLPGKSHEQRSLVSYSPWGPKRVGHDLVTKQQHIQIHGTVKHRFVCGTLSFSLELGQTISGTCWLEDLLYQIIADPLSPVYLPRAQGHLFHLTCHLVCRPV